MSKPQINLDSMTVEAHEARMRGAWGRMELDGYQRNLLRRARHDQRRIFERGRDNPADYTALEGA